MIRFEKVCKRYVTDHEPGNWVLQDATFTIPSRACVGLIGDAGSGKSTLLRLIGGFEMPTSGKIDCTGRIASPLTFMRAFQPLLSGRQNAKFVCRINGFGDGIDERLARIEELAGLGANFEKPVSGYTPVLKQALSFALSMSFDFDTYLSDFYDFSGAAGFKDMQKAEEGLTALTKKAGIIMVTKGGQANATLKKYCKSGIWLHEGKAEWFDSIDDAIEAQSNSRPATQSKSTIAVDAHPVTESAMQIIEKMKLQTYFYRVLTEGLHGAPAKVSEQQGNEIIKAATQLGMNLLDPNQVMECGYQIVEGAIPVLRKASHTAIGGVADLYDLNTQCFKLEMTG